MERLQWWLLLLSAVMFSMSGCAKHQASSVKSRDTAASITEKHKATAAAEAAVPTPTGAATTMAATPPAAAAQPVETRGAASDTTTGGTTAAPSSTARPVVGDFAAVADLIDVFFDFDKYDIRSADATTLDSNAKWLKSNPNHLVLIEGHGDERGTNEYNLALAERRANSAMNYLVSQGVQANRITINSNGKERPQCTEHTEACWAKNRRAHFLVKPQEREEVIAVAPKTADDLTAGDVRVGAPTAPTTVPRESWWERTPPDTKNTAVAGATPAPAKAAGDRADRLDVTGHWRGRWVASGAWGERRESDAEMVFVPSSKNAGTGRLRLKDTVAAVGVPEIVRNFGALGTPMNYRVSRSEVVARFEDGPAVRVRFTRVGERLVGRIDGSPSFRMVLERQ